MKRSRLKQPPANFRNEEMNFFHDSNNHNAQESFSNIELNPNESLFGSTSKNNLSFATLPIVDEVAKDAIEDTPKRRPIVSGRNKLKSSQPPKESPRGNKSPRHHDNGEVKLSEEEYYHDLAMAQKAEGVEYVDAKDLEPVKSPAQEFQKALRGLETQEWPELFHTLTTMRRVVLYHPQVVMSSGALHSIIVLIMKQVENLRSSLAKNALMTIADFFLGLKRGMDSEVQTIVPGVMKVSLDPDSSLIG